MVRIIAGRARGRRLEVPRGDGTRPTSDKVRGALFDALAHALGGACDDARVLDLFAGAGTLGLEAWSRGARHVTFVERDRRAAAVLRRNVEAARADAAVVVRPVAAFLAGPPSPFDLVLLDPPYAAGAVEPTLTALHAGGWLAPEALVCVEHPSGGRLIPPAGLVEAWSRTYGGTSLTVLEAVEA
ncbi:MAG: 16S rRNA (guanine(966)-N(2))-methyltransferase RsmD [Myxococcales bacterium]|nr:16S rRNA (guanine(966)-N(2))-methyltransferase RsmD [Myxococcales bacterium]